MPTTIATERADERADRERQPRDDGVPVQVDAAVVSFESAKPLMPASIICAREIWPT